VTADRTHALIEALGARPVSLVTTGATVCNLACVARTSVGNEHPHAFLHVGALRSCLTIFMDEHLSFLREFRFGEADLLNALQESMQMDADEVRGLYLSGSFDIRTAVNPTLSPWLHQLGISFDFFERRHGRSVRACYLIGEGTRLRSLLMCVSGAIQCPTATWDPGDDIGCLQLAATPGEDLDDFLLPLTEACRVFTGESSRAV
jgi:Tfp pilus assembly PilM family ATPase